ncbi:MAG: hypothetical protein H6943_11095 [Zoogloeaceae bacterium]|nr:hypothetical protein [Zoogloeaceae bacterium]
MSDHSIGSPADRKRRDQWTNCIREMAAAGSLLLCGLGLAQAGVVEDYNAKPIISGHSADYRWQERTRIPGDPEVVLGKDWRRSFWAFSPSYEQKLNSQAENRPPQPPFVVTEHLSPGLEAIELRVSWDSEVNLYRCSYHLFISPHIPVAFFSQSIGGTVSMPQWPPGLGPAYERAKWQAIRESLGGTIISSSIQMLNGPTITEARYRYPTENMSYVAFYQGSGCGPLGHSKAAKELSVGVVIEPKQAFSGTTTIIREHTYAMFVVPDTLIRQGAPYFRRAQKINDCYFSERRSQRVLAQEPASSREQRVSGCALLRSAPIESSEKPFDINRLEP